MGTIQLYSDAQLLYSRPYYAQLRSNVMYINRYTYEGGNPFLLPSLSHNITLGTTYKWVYLSAGYQYVKDAIISFSGAYSEDDPTIALINMINAPDYDKILPRWFYHLLWGFGLHRTKESYVIKNLV